MTKEEIEMKNLREENSKLKEENLKLKNSLSDICDYCIATKNLLRKLSVA